MCWCASGFAIRLDGLIRVIVHATKFKIKVRALLPLVRESELVLARTKMDWKRIKMKWREQKRDWKVRGAIKKGPLFLVLEIKKGL